MPPAQEPSSAVSSHRVIILEHARNIPATFDPRKIEDVAARSNIVLARIGGPVNREAGFAYIEFTKRPVFIESLANPGMPVRVWGEGKVEPMLSIVINTNSGLPEWEVFWHEYYHLFYSPQAIQRSDRFEHHYSTEGVLHSKEERRADEFAAAVLIPSIEGCETVFDLIDRYDSSERLAKIAIEFYLS